MEPETGGNESEAPAPAPTLAPGELAGIEMALSQDLAASPGCPWVELCISFPRVYLSYPAEARTVSLTVELDGEPVADWPELVLEPGLEQRV